MTILAFPEGAVAQSFNHNSDLDLSIWRYFLAQEEAFLQTLRYVELRTENIGSTSIEFSRQLAVNGAEFENLTKQLSLKVKGVEPGNMGQYKDFLLMEYPNMIDKEVYIDRYRLKEQPFSGWAPGERLDWWDLYTELKHSRSSSSHFASMGMVLTSLCSLLVLAKLLYDAHSSSGSAKLFGTQLLRIDGLYEYAFISSNE